MTTTHENIAAALAAFQAEMPTVAKSKTATPNWLCFQPSPWH